MKRLERKVSIVTGSSSGIGKAMALRFAEEGASVVVAARRRALCEQVSQLINDRGGIAQSIPTDIRDELQVEQLFAQTIQRFGRVDILMNNAGIFSGGPITEAKTTTFDQVQNTNVRGTFFCCRAGFRYMKDQWGRDDHEYVQCCRNGCMGRNGRVQFIEVCHYGIDEGLG